MLRDRFEAIMNSDATLEQKRMQISAFSIEAITQHTKFMTGLGWESPTGIKYIMNSVSGSVINNTPMLIFNITRTKIGERFDPFDQLRVLNPPLGEGNLFLDEMNQAEKLKFIKGLVTESDD